MRPLVLVVLFSLVSCGPPAYLVKDRVFSVVAPEIVEAWSSLSPWHDARTSDLGDRGAPELDKVLSTYPKNARVLVGVSLTADQRRRLVSDHPGLALRFFGPPGDPVPTLAVDRAQAWALVAAAAAAPGPGWVVFPADVTPDQQEAFSRAWAGAHGGPLTVCRWPSTVPFQATSVLFDWAGPPADSFFASAVGQRPIHGDPGTPGSLAFPAVHWAIKKQGLADFLWKIATNSSSIVEFIPLETVLDSR